MMLASAIKVSGAYTLAFAVALVAALLAFEFFDASRMERLLPGLMLIGITYLISMAVFQLVFGLATDIGRSLRYWPIAMLICGLSLALGWLVILIPLVKDLPVNTIWGFGPEVVASLHVTAALLLTRYGQILVVGLAFGLGLLAALFATRRTFRAEARGR